MMVICAPPMNLLLAMLGFLTAVVAAWWGSQLLVRGLRQADHPAGALWVVRGIRGVVVGIGLGALSGGVLLANKGLLVFGVIFLGEELYETGVVLLALRSRLKTSSSLAYRSNGRAPASGRGIRRTPSCLLTLLFCGCGAG